MFSCIPSLLAHTHTHTHTHMYKYTHIHTGTPPSELVIALTLDATMSAAAHANMIAAANKSIYVLNHGDGKNARILPVGVSVTIREVYTKECSPSNDLAAMRALINLLSHETRGASSKEERWVGFIVLSSADLTDHRSIWFVTLFCFFALGGRSRISSFYSLTLTYSSPLFRSPHQPPYRYRGRNVQFNDSYAESGVIKRVRNPLYRFLVIVRHPRRQGRVPVLPPPEPLQL